MIDPLNGQTDLKEKILRVCRDDSFQTDPARLLRAVRMALKYGLRLEKNSLILLKAAVPGLNRVSMERQRDELFKMFDFGQSRPAVELMDRLSLLENLLPELSPLKTCEQSAPHIWNAWMHSLAILHQADILLDILLLPKEQRRFSAESLMPALSLGYLGKYRDAIYAHFENSPVPLRSRRSLLLFSALLHDVGKAATRSVETQGRTRFFNHESQGASLARLIAEKWVLSHDEVLYVEKMVALHMRIHHLAHNEGLPDKRVIHRFYRDAGELGIDLCILSLADTLATWGTTLPVDVWNRELQICTLLMEAWCEKKDEVVSPQRLLTGKEIMALLQIPPGIMIGRILEDLKEAQAVGEVLTYEAAVHYIKQWYDRHKEGEDYGSISHN
ncbi:MAG: HD domain-containing protein [Anaerolineae bacterium]|nr:HD domain-containing protein [Anaerolineae bacterium]